MKKITLLILLTLPYYLVAQSGSSVQLPWSQRMAASIMTTNADSIAYPNKMARWEYEPGVLLQSLELLWYRTGDVRYFNYIKKNMDRFVNADGTIRTYDLDHFNIDYVTPGRSLLMLYQQTLPNKEKYRKAADLLRQQLAKQPRTNEGGFWHKKIYPNQMWLDGLYMAEPFYAEYTRLFDRDGKDFTDIINQFVWMEQHARDSKTGLLYHGWDESRQQKWADPKNGGNRRISGAGPLAGT